MVKFLEMNEVVLKEYGFLYFIELLKEFGEFFFLEFLLDEIISVLLFVLLFFWVKSFLNEI